MMSRIREKLNNRDIVVCFSFFFWLRVLDKAEYSAFESTLNSPIVSYRIVSYRIPDGLCETKIWARVIF